MMTILIKLNLLQIPEALAGYIVYHMTGYLVLVIIKITLINYFQSFHPNNLLVLLKCGSYFLL